MKTPIPSLNVTAWAVAFALSVMVPANAAVLMGLAPDNGVSGTSAGDGTSGTGAALDDVNATSSYVGRSSSSRVATFVFVFELPTLQNGESIDSASLTIQTLSNASALGANIDLYGLGYRDTSTVTTADYYVGPLDTTNATLLKESWFATGTTYGVASRTTDAGAGASLVNYLNAQYANGATGGDYVFLRLNYDAFPSLADGAGGRIQVATANNTTSGYPPFITYTVIPEPAGTSLFVLGVSLIVLRARRRSRALPSA